MRRFADLYARLDSTTSTLEKVAAIRDYLHGAPAADAAWAVWFLTGRRMKGLMAGARLREWATEVTGLPDWLVEDAYSAVGDQAETVALLLDAHGMPHAPRSVDRTAVPDADAPLATWAERFVRPLKGLDDDTRRARLVAAWSVLLGEPATDEREHGAAAAGTATFRQRPHGPTGTGCARCSCCTSS